MAVGTELFLHICTKELDISTSEELELVKLNTWSHFENTIIYKDAELVFQPFKTRYNMSMYNVQQ